MNYYYDEQTDNCPIHKDQQTDLSFTLELSIPIGFDKPHAHWKASHYWALKLLQQINPMLNKDERKVLGYKMKIQHTGTYDDQTCVKYFLNSSHDDECTNNNKEIID